MGLKQLKKEWDKRKKKGITFMVIPQFEGRLRSFSCSVRLVVGVVVLLVLFFLFNLYIYVNYTSQVYRAAELRRQNIRLRKENNLVKPALREQEFINQQLAEIKRQHEEIMNEAHALNKKTGRKFSLPSRGLGLRLRSKAVELQSVYHKTNKFINVSILRENARLLKEEIERRQEEMKIVKSTLQALEHQVDHTPSIWPVYGRITSRFGWRWDPISKDRITFHRGLDIKVSMGTPVRVSADGIVKCARWGNGYGYLVEVNHGYGLTTIYAHLSRFKVVAGQKVKKGQVIAYSGNSGNRSTGPHLHYEVRVAGRPINPYPYLSW